MSTAEVNAEAFGAEAGVTPVVNNVDVDAPTVPIQNTKFYTEDDLAKVRSQEKEKLYPQIEKLKEEVDVLKRSREEEAARFAAEENERQARIAQEQKAKEESELEVRDLLAKKEKEWAEQLERERQERETAFALLERERTYAELQNYRAQKLDAERDNIMPELVDLISGNTKEEIDASIEGLKERSNRILESAQSAMQNARREMTGTRATLPPAGPLETNSEQKSYTAQDIASMSMDEYAKYRGRLLSPGAQGKTKGLFG
jgi:DNA repair exonuclease SbcCD ATPase subunit